MVRAGVVQMTSGEDVETNLAVAERLVRRAVDEGARLVVLPECFAFLGPDRRNREVAEGAAGRGFHSRSVRIVGSRAGRGADSRRLLGERLRF